MPYLTSNNKIVYVRQYMPATRASSLLVRPAMHHYAAGSINLCIDIIPALKSSLEKIINSSISLIHKLSKQPFTIIDKHGLVGLL
jgi:hypothetical protein